VPNIECLLQSTEGMSESLKEELGAFTKKVSLLLSKATKSFWLKPSARQISEEGS